MNYAAWEGRSVKAVVKDVDLEVADGVLDFTLPHAEGVTPVINAIEIIRE